VIFKSIFAIDIILLGTSLSIHMWHVDIVTLIQKSDCLSVIGSITVLVHANSLI